MALNKHLAWLEKQTSRCLALAHSPIGFLSTSWPSLLLSSRCLNGTIFMLVLIDVIQLSRSFSVSHDTM